MPAQQPQHPSSTLATTGSSFLRWPLTETVPARSNTNTNITESAMGTAHGPNTLTTVDSGASMVATTMKTTKKVRRINDPIKNAVRISRRMIEFISKRVSEIL
jgi:hypothetical protein